MNRAAVLLVANYDGNVGYAWNNIYRLFNAIGRAMSERGLGMCVSFPALTNSESVLDATVAFETFTFNPRDDGRAALAQVKPYFERFGIRHVYFTDQKPTRWLYAVLRSWGVETIVIHNRVSVPDPHPAKAEKGLRWIVKSVIGRMPWATADRIYAVSGFVANRLIRKGCLPPARVRTILNGIDVDYWKCAPRISLADSPVTFFASARATREKGILVLVEAAHLLRRAHGVDCFRVRYAGDGPHLPAFKEAVVKSDLADRFEFLGRQDNTREEVCAADVIVVPSAYGDACPSTVSEALASGRPLITTRAGGIPELVGDAQNALIVPPGDAEGLAAAMARLACDQRLRQAVGERGRQRAERHLRQDAYHRAVIEALLTDFKILNAALPAESQPC
jgi:glycosyltransferase involved in cell wall biosynthesis